jgi:transcription-repair coupling factor (superfamily II helicase)
VRFKDLGLLIVDEEQRFGVTHKERIKQMRADGGRADPDRHAHPAHAAHVADRRARHLGTIETPPEDRLPIQTTIGEYDET